MRTQQEKRGFLLLMEADMTAAIFVSQKIKDFPSDAPILLITDGYIEDQLYVKRRHAYLLPKGNKLPYQAKGRIIYFDQV